MDFNGFTQEDFDVFLIDGLEQRMKALKEKIRPKLESLGQYFAPTLSTLTGEEMFVHVAKHARRTINPPKDTWVAFANNRRGYKMLPHFQIGMWHTHLFIWFAIIYEAPRKEVIAEKFLQKGLDIFETIPKDFVWSLDHMKPETIEHQQITIDEMQSYFQRLQTVKKAELLCGYTIAKDKAINMGGRALLHQIDEVFKTVAPLYQTAIQ
ncbi:YktB family protein [Bacillus rubiinfantis]|uniref:YktB family protein n=1 Tax=Bacillus rubiinfantis TaxID=1499680 RepID=UPI0005A9A027|nr:DUF1054 domain-containing protein [Bacillus rubiinfantis]